MRLTRNLCLLLGCLSWAGCQPDLATPVGEMSFILNGTRYEGNRDMIAVENSDNTISITTWLLDEDDYERAGWGFLWLRPTVAVGQELDNVFTREDTKNPYSYFTLRDGDFPIQRYMIVSNSSDITIADLSDNLIALEFDSLTYAKNPRFNDDPSVPDTIILTDGFLSVPFERD